VNCKPGDLAYLIKGADGLFAKPPIVEVISAWGTYPSLGKLWNCASREAQFIGRLWSSGDVTGDAPSIYFQVPDDWLRPISGAPVGEDIPVETNIPEAVTLAWGINTPVLA
jgi:hypothetical protein